MKLHELGVKHKTDKASHGYLDLYEFYLNGLSPVQNILEIGVRTGASLRMWSEFFPYAFIDGIDINPECRKHETDNIRIHIGDQTDSDFLSTVLSSSYDLIIDDGSHVNEWTVKTFKLLWPRLRKGGIYILEDMQCSYQDLEKIGARQKWSGMSLVPKIPKQKRETIDNLLTEISHQVDFGEIEAIHVHKGFIMVIK